MEWKGHEVSAGVLGVPPVIYLDGHFRDPFSFIHRWWIFYR